MGNQSSTMYRLNFEDIQEVIKKKEQYILINTLSPNNQSCLLPNTVSCGQEEQIVNHYISHNKDKNIVIYFRPVRPRYNNHRFPASLARCEFYSLP